MSGRDRCGRAVRGGRLARTVSARMKPFSKSVWMTPAACGAVMPSLMVHALVSFSPDVKYVLRPRFLYVAPISRGRPPSVHPRSARNSSFSSGSSCCSSASTLADTTTTSAPSCSAYSRSVPTSALLAPPSARLISSTFAA